MTVRRQWPMNAMNVMKSGKATNVHPLNVSQHREISINVDAEITDRRWRWRWDDIWYSADQGGLKLLQEPRRCLHWTGVCWIASSSGCHLYILGHELQNHPSLRASSGHKLACHQQKHAIRWASLWHSCSGWLRPWHSMSLPVSGIHHYNIVDNAKDYWHRQRIHHCSIVSIKHCTTSSIYIVTGDACSPTDRPLDLTGNSGTLTSSNYPSNYDNDADCQWRIMAISTIQVSKRFTASSSIQVSKIQPLERHSVLDTRNRRYSDCIVTVYIHELNWIELQSVWWLCKTHYSDMLCVIKNSVVKRVTLCL